MVSCFVFVVVVFGYFLLWFICCFLFVCLVCFLFVFLCKISLMVIKNLTVV